MSIPSSQLDTWANQGGVVGAQKGHTSVRTALEAHDWPNVMSYTTYLQGSYANSTNIRGDSDVDLVVETDSVFYSNLLQKEKDQKGLVAADHSWSEFRNEVVRALRAYYSTEAVHEESNCVRVDGSSNRLPVDVVVAAEYRRYHNGALAASGITFWSDRGSGPQVINYPKLHLKHGAAKNANTMSRFKPTVRMVKNARLRLPLDSGAIRRRFPSYFVECLLYNANSMDFVSDSSDRFLRLLQWMQNLRDSTGFESLVTQSREHYLVGSGSVQWGAADVTDFISMMIDLWNDWS